MTDPKFQHQILVRMTVPEYEYLLAHSLAYGVSATAVMRKALGLLQALESTPGAMSALMTIHARDARTRAERL